MMSKTDHAKIESRVNQEQAQVIRFPRIMKSHKAMLSEVNSDSFG